MTVEELNNILREQDRVIETLQRRIEALEIFQRSLTLIVGVKQHERTKRTTTKNTTRKTHTQRRIR